MSSEQGSSYSLKHNDIIFEISADGEPDHESDVFKWNHNTTLIFLDLYKKYRPKVGCLKIKNLKKMFELISINLKLSTGYNVTTSNCENRWKHLERSYKKYCDNNKKTGRGRKDFEYSNQMAEILGPKKSINPVLLLSSDNIDIPPLAEQPTTSNENVEPTASTSKENQPIQYRPKQKQKNYKVLKADILKEIRRERQAYYRTRLEMEQKKIKIKEEILEEKRIKNRILAEQMGKNINEFKNI